MNTFEYNFDELPLVIENGFQCCDVTGTAEISYTKDGEWGVEAIYFDGAKRNHWTLEQQMEAFKRKDSLPFWDRKQVQLDRGTPIFSIIHDRLENEWHSKVQEAVNEQIAEDQQCAADNYHDARRDELMLERN